MFFFFFKLKPVSFNQLYNSEIRVPVISTDQNQKYLE